MINYTAHLFDKMEAAWESNRWHRGTGTLLVIVFLISIVVIEANINGLLPSSLENLISKNHLYAIDVALSLLLVIEVVSLILSLAHSVSTSVGVQFEILSLLLLRVIFKEFAHITEPIDWEHVSVHMSAILSAAVGALAIFVILGFYYRIQQHTPITSSEREQKNFIASKKVISLMLLLSFIILISGQAASIIGSGITVSIFDDFFTLLVFSDILMVLLALRYSSSYPVAFRNTAFAVSTVLIRLTFLVPTEIGAALGVGAALLTLATSYAYNFFCRLGGYQAIQTAEK